MAVKFAEAVDVMCEAWHPGFTSNADREDMGRVLEVMMAKGIVGWWVDPKPTSEEKTTEEKL